MKRIYRSKKDRIIGGVCGGIGEYFNVDPLLVDFCGLRSSLQVGLVCSHISSHG